MEQRLDDYSIWIVDGRRKNELILKYGKDRLFHSKIMSLEDFKKKYYFSYDKRAVYYLMKKYHYSYDVCLMYLSHLLEASFGNEKMPKVNKLMQIKNELEENSLLITCSYFKEYLKGKKILVYDINHFSKLEERMFREIEKDSLLFYFHEEKYSHHHSRVIECDTLEKEVSYVAGEIVKLIQRGIDIKNIKVCATNSYEAVIQRIFAWFKIPHSLSNSCLYATEIGQYFLKGLQGTREESLKYLEQKYPLTNDKNLEIYNQIVNVLNEYTWCDSFLELEAFLKEDFKNIKMDQVIHSNVVTIINSLEVANDSDYVFLLGFNQGEVPRTYKDEDYFSDKEKKILCLDTTDELNQQSYYSWLEQIRRIKNLTITTKKNGPLGECYLSSLNDDLHLELTPYQEDYCCSNLYNRLELSSMLDTLVKYNEMDKNLSLLYQHYPNIEYRTYQNDYQPISEDRIRKYLGYHLTLSYSSINVYYQCAFRYYLSHILKLNIYEETFYTILGNLFHHILSLVFTKEIDVKEEYYRYIERQSYSFNAREKYFLSSLEKELEFVIETILKQENESKLCQIYAEEKIEILKRYEDMEVTFKGFVDKMMLNSQLDEVLIVDYKTGNPDLNLNHIIYGLDLQLPVYVYLASHRFPEARVIGFYLQKIMNTEITKDNKHSFLELKEDKLKLQGYTNSDFSLIQDFDPHYEDSRVIRGLKMTSKGISLKKILDDVGIDQLRSITDQKIDEAIQGIAQADFSINPKKIGMEMKGCLYCQFKDICFKTEKNIVHLKEFKNMEFLGGDVDDTNEAS